MFASRRLIVVAVAFASVLLCPIAPARAADATIQVVTEEWPPYDYAGRDGEAAGLNTEIVRATLAQAGISGKIVVYPWARALFLARNRPNTLIFSLSRSKERENRFIWIGELMRRNDWFYRAVGRRSIAPGSIDEIKSCCTVCVVNKDIVEDDLKRLGFEPHKQYIATPSFSDCMKMVQTGSVPLLVNSPLDLAWAMKRHSEIRTSFEPVLPLSASGQEPLYLAASVGTSPDIVRRLRSALQTLQQTGQIDQIRRQFMDRLRSGQILPAAK